MPGARVTGAEGTRQKSGVSEGLVGYAGVTQREEEADDEGEDDLRDGDVLFFVNRGGLPVDEATWERMWRHVSRIHPEGDVIGRKIRGATDLPKKVKIGQYVSHDPHSVEQIEWKHSILDVDRLTHEEFRKELERHTRDMRLKIGKAAPPSPTKERKRDVGSPQRSQSSPHRRNSRGERR
ncbi:UNVERIFIED_CONTAM: hypothetical protein FKN15_012148 [Acipenser sinensis]